MAHYDEARGAIVARILYDGLGTAGKTSSLRRLREILSQRSGEIYVPEEHRGRTLYFDWLEIEAGRLDDHPLRVHLMTVPGQWAYVHRRYTLLRSADALIGVVDSTPQGLVRAAYAINFLRRVLARSGAPPLVVQAHKQDLADAAPVDVVRQRLDVVTPIIGTSAVTGEGLVHSFVTALQSARAHIRHHLGGRAPSTLPPLVESPEELYVRMREEARSPEELEGERVLAEVLEEMEWSNGTG
jgi:signal recognition particle receptor subunit beta